MTQEDAKLIEGSL